MNLFKETKKLFSKNPKITLKLLCFSNKLINMHYNNDQNAKINSDNDSMPRRLAEVIGAEGGHTRY